MAIDQVGLRLSIESTILLLQNTRNAMLTVQYIQQYTSLLTAYVQRRETLGDLLISITIEQERLQNLADGLDLSQEEQQSLPPDVVADLARQRQLALAEIGQLQVLADLMLPWINQAPPPFAPLVSTTALFDLDDRVRYIGSGTPAWTGTLGRIVARSQDGDDWTYHVSLDDGPSLADVPEADLIEEGAPWEPPEEPPEEEEPPEPSSALFRLGDRVRYIGDDLIQYQGLFATVDERERVASRWLYGIDLEGGPDLQGVPQADLIFWNQPWAPPTQEDPFEDFGLGDLTDIDFWVAIFEYIGDRVWGALFAIPGQVADAWAGLADWSSSIYSAVGSVAGDVLLGLDDVLATWSAWVRDEIIMELPRVGGGVGDALSLGLGPLIDLLKPTAILDVIQTVRDPLSLVISSGLTAFLEFFEGVIPDAWRDLVDEILPDRDLLPPALARMFDWDDFDSLAWGPLVVAAAIGAVGNIMAQGGMALGARAIWELNERFTPRLLGQEEVTTLRWRIPQNEVQWKIDLKRLGIPEDKQNQLAAALRPIPGLTVIRDAKFRDKLTEAEVHQAIGAWGYTQDAEDMIRDTWPVLPGVQDVIRFGVREVYRDEIVEAFGLDSEFPAEVTADAARVGLAEEEVRKYWRAHWELPSINQAFDMFHRTTTDPIQGWSEPLELSDGSTVHRVIGDERIDQLLFTQDVMLGWREPLKRIAFTPFTRVDIRRLYRTGVFQTVAEVERAYTDIGYSPENALLQAEFVVSLEREQTFNALETILGGQAAEGTIELADALEQLDEITVPDRVRENAERRMFARVNRERLGDVISAFRQAFRYGRISEADFRDELEDRGLPDATIAHLIDIERTRQGLDFDVFAAAESRAAGRTSPMRRFREGLTSDEQFEAEMADLGYGDLDIERFGRQAVLDADTDLRLDTLAAYRAGLRTRRLSVGEFRQLASDLGIDDVHIEVLVLQDELRRALDAPTAEEAELRASGRGIVTTRYREGWIDADQFAAEMSMLGYSTLEIDRYALEADLRFDLDWRTDLLALAKRDLEVAAIDADGYLDRLDNLGMDPDRAQTHLARAIAGLQPRVGLPSPAADQPEQA